MLPRIGAASNGLCWQSSKTCYFVGISASLTTRGVDPVLKVGGTGTNLYVCIFMYIYIYIYIYIYNI